MKALWTMYRRDIFLALMIVAAIVIMAGCQSIQNPTEAFGSSYASITTVAHDISQAKASGLISDVQAADLKAQLQAAKTNLDLATQAYAAGATAEANDRLEQTHLVLAVLIRALKDRGVE